MTDSRKALRSKMLKAIKNYLPALKQYNRRQFSHTQSLSGAHHRPPPPPPHQCQQSQNTFPDNRFQPNHSYEGFKCLTAQYIPDFNMTAYHFQHERVCAEFLHIDRNDQNNVFCIIFRTTPYDSTGMPHILEHSVLCGSERYPVRDPFFKMANRSVSTFMNAFTGPDYTMYPFSSMNRVDFTNLQKIYLDAAFRPNLRYHDFLQEGWRLENSNLKDINSEYIIKGVVYNEMKGAMSEVSSYLAQKFLSRILPDDTYSHCSGGEPLAIPELKHHDLVEFHRKYYHPSNARFFSYGNFDPLPSMQYINETYLADCQPIDTSFSEVRPQPRWSAPKRDAIPCRYDNMGAPIERQHQIAIGYLASDITDIYETLLLNVLAELLVKGPNSIFYKNLIEPNISGGYSSVTGFENSMRDTMFTVGLHDCESKDLRRIEEIFDLTIEEVILSGFDPQHVNSVLNNFELSLKHQHPKFGLGLLFAVSPVWRHGGNIIESLQYGRLLAQMRQNLNDNPRYLQEKVDQYFRKNSHRLVLTMSPDADYERKFADNEAKLIAAKANALTPADKQQVFAESSALSKAQLAKENTDILPCLSLEEVEQAPPPYQLDVTRIHGIPTQICTTDTNNVTYINAIFNGAELLPHQKLLLPILAHIIDQMGTATQDYRMLDKLINLHTSGITFRTHFAEHFNDLSKFQVGLSLQSYCLEQNVGKMFELIHDLVRRFNFDDVKRFEMLLQNYQSTLTVGITESGHRYAMQSAAGLVNEAQFMKTRLSGIEHVDYVKHLMETTPIDVILQQLKEVAAQLFGGGSLRCALNTSERTRLPCLQHYTDFLKHTTNRDHTRQHRWENSGILPPVNLHKVMTIPVNYCAKSILAVPYDHPDYSALRVLGKILSAKYLLPVVREQNGAYGAGAQISNNGMFSFYSYRDPNSVRTLDTFDASPQWIMDNWQTIDKQVLFEAKLGVLQLIDEPVSPGLCGEDYLKYGISQNMTAEHRRRTLAVNHEDLQRCTELYLKNPALPTSRFVLGPENKDLQNRKWSVQQQ